MIDKSHLHHLYRKLQPFKVWYFLAAFLICSGLTVLMLRQNFEGMVKRRDAVYQADQSGQNVEMALQNLRSYVAAHMNTNLSSGTSVYPPIQLKYTYERLQKTAQDKAATTNQTIYSDAQTTCEKLYPASFSGGPRVPCIENYVNTHGVKAATVPDSAYKFDFVSPSWSPDLAGVLLLISVILLALTVLRVALGAWLKRFSE